MNFTIKAQNIEWNKFIIKDLINDEIKNAISFTPILFKYSFFLVSLKWISLYIFIEKGIE